MKKKPDLTPEERVKVYEKCLPQFESQEALDLEIDIALDHSAAKKAGNSGSWSLYVLGWLRRPVYCPSCRNKFQRTNTNGNKPTRDESLRGL